MDDVAPAMLFELAVREGELEAVIEPMVEAILERGEKIEGWPANGLDFNKLMREFENANGSAYYVEKSDTGLVISYPGESTDLLGEGYVRHRLLESQADGSLKTDLFQLFPDIWLEMVSGNISVGQAQCSAGVSFVDLRTARPISQWSDEEFGMAAMIYSLLQKFAEADICTTYNKDVDGMLINRAFDSSGRALPTLNEQADPGKIVSRDDVLAMIANEAASPPQGE
ncbi:hypothetical protein Q9K02_04665 [Qipengyuania sp. G39]|uniref:Uncharacterized protein n=1 Tax=Qipengyuania profundimaris TaxID=3067652 RepID=A0ABT9HMP7_9SPHN|nr:hypothetical protein [Qipengyuania sp. G39]MDP4574429.1 hypothetical protein [Qipengyuania sp. G39]